MVYSRNLADRFPEIVKISDQSQLMNHFADSIQPTLNIFADRIDTEEYLYDWESCPADFLDWLGQIVGLSASSENFLGTGINPKWTVGRKRELISLAWIYWQLLGTRMGVREAFYLWLNWVEARDPNYLQILHPFGDRSLSIPPAWWGYTTPYDWNLIRSVKNLKRIGAGIDPDNWYQPLWRPDPTDEASLGLFNGLHQGLGSAIGPGRPWLHLHLNLGNWNEVANQSSQLVPQAFSVEADPVIVGWLDFSGGVTEYPALPVNPPIIFVDEVPGYVCESIESGYLPAIVSIEPVGTGSFDSLATLPTDGSIPASVNYLCSEAATLFDRYPRLKIISNPANWQAIIAGSIQSYAVSPVTVFFADEDLAPSLEFSWIAGTNRIYLEFVFRTQERQRWDSVNLNLEGVTVLSQTFTDPEIYLDPGIYVCCRFGFEVEVAQPD
jgi:hypothetical protein